MTVDPAARWSVLGNAAAGGRQEVWDLADDVNAGILARAPWSEEQAGPAVGTRPLTRWVWSDTERSYPALLDRGVRVERSWDLRLCRRILRRAGMLGDASTGPSPWDASAPLPEEEGFLAGFASSGETASVAACHTELNRQRGALADADGAPGIRLLLQAESAGALAAAEMRSAGLPWDRAAHERVLSDMLGARTPVGGPPLRMQRLASQVRDALDDDRVDLDSPSRLLRALRNAGLPVTTTSRHELAGIDHPAIAPLMEYRRLSRLLTAHGWSWLEAWVRDGRFRPSYLPGGVVTGRWGAQGGGVLQIPRPLRAAVRADPGWVIVDADVAQLEPRVLAGMSRDLAMGEAARGRDLYAGLVRAGAVGTRQEAKYAVLGAMYGATTGESGRLVPRLRRSFPAAMRLVDEAAAAGEEGHGVSTWLGRATPDADPEWRELVDVLRHEGTTKERRDRATRAARERGRFTRNFVVQGTAAEWALCWLAEIRARLRALGETEGPSALRSGPLFSTRPHLVLFLHDEVMVHAPESMADAVADVVRDAAAAAGRRLFGSFPIDFPLDVGVGVSAESGPALS